LRKRRVAALAATGTVGQTYVKTLEDHPYFEQVTGRVSAGTVPGMRIVAGRVGRGLDDRSLRFTILSHNAVREAAGSAILTPELMQSRSLLG
jgi:aspartate-semialdehyde dehydrogenase